MMTDPIADMLTRIRNALTARKRSVDIPASKLKVELARILQEEGYVEGYEVVEGGPQATLRVTLRRTADGTGVILGLERVSRPGCRVYVGKDDIPRVQGGLGINILSTSRGLMTGGHATREGVGGEILCNIW
jgi:small subunit ribosomal protein S8